MITISGKQDCCGCAACAQVCPKRCIFMSEDGEGFLYPEVDKEICVDCHLCEKVCPVLNQGRERKPLKVYAAINKDEEIRRQSSSGGIFTLLAEQVIDEGGVVFGARFNENWEVVHSYTETKEGLAAFRGSKYVQSRMGDNYRKAESFLKSGRKVLFSGTPCQIAGLKLYLGKEYCNLLTVDFICHGVPSPGVWREYLREEVARQCDGKNSVLLSEPLNKNLFLRGFLADLYLRPSCHACPAKCLKSGSDVTIGDFWGIGHVLPEMDDDKGTSVVMVNRDKFDFQKISCKQEVKSYAQYSIYKFCKKPVLRCFLFHDKKVNFSTVRIYSNILRAGKDLRKSIYRLAGLLGVTYVYKKIKSR